MGQPSSVLVQGEERSTLADRVHIAVLCVSREASVWSLSVSSGSLGQQLVDLNLKERRPWAGAHECGRRGYKLEQAGGDLIPKCGIFWKE